MCIIIIIRYQCSSNSTRYQSDFCMAADFGGRPAFFCAFSAFHPFSGRAALRVKFLGKFQYRSPRSHPKIRFTRDFPADSVNFTRPSGDFQLSLLAAAKNALAGARVHTGCRGLPKRGVPGAEFHSKTLDSETPQLPTGRLPQILDSHPTPSREAYSANAPPLPLNEN